MNKKVSVKSILGLIDDNLLDNLAEETGVDFNIKKLSGKVIFKLLLMTILDDSKASLRIMEKIYLSNKFKQYSGLDKEDSIKFNSLSERLSLIKESYFEKIFTHLIHNYRSSIRKDLDKQFIRQFDSTSISLSGKLLKKGMVNGLKNKQNAHTHKQIKFTVGLYQNLPSSVQFYNEQKYLAEDETLKQAVLKSCIASNEIAVFDRGIKARKTYQEFSQQNIQFVTRINPTKNIKILQQNALPIVLETDTLTIVSDEIVHLYYAKKMKLKEPIRLIKALSKSTNEMLYFLTNIEDLTAIEVTEIYRQRWDIEVFFKFIKQHLHFKHFFSYNENGIKVMMYMTLIAAILLLLYKKQNAIEGYKIAKFCFVEELELEIIKEIVVFCGGDPSKSPLLNNT